MREVIDCRDGVEVLYYESSKASCQGTRANDVSGLLSASSPVPDDDQQGMPRVLTNVLSGCGRFRCREILLAEGSMWVCRGRI